MKLTDLTLDPRFTVEELIYLPRKFVNGYLPEIDEDSSFVGFGGLPVMEDVD